MRISNSPTFGSKILYSAKLKENNFWNPPKGIDVLISELERNDIVAIKKSNSLLQNTTCGGQALYSFENECRKPLFEFDTNKKFIVVENQGPLATDKYMGIAELYDKQENLYVKKLQSLRDFPAYKNIKGIGCCIMYAIFKMAQNSNKKSIELTSFPNARDFYRQLGMTQNLNEFKINYDDLEKPLKSIKDTFGIEEFKK